MTKREFLITPDPLATSLGMGGMMLGPAAKKQLKPVPHVPWSPDQVVHSETAQWLKIMRQAAVDLRTSLPGFLVEDMDLKTQTVTVQLAIQERVQTQQGAKWYDLSPVQMVPVVLPRGGGYAITMPLKKGDEGLLVFCDCCFDLWWQNGIYDAPPADNAALDEYHEPIATGSQRQLMVRRHEYWDCGFIPGMCDQTRVLTAYSDHSVQIRTEDATTFVEVGDGPVTVQAPAGFTVIGPLSNINNTMMVGTGATGSFTTPTGQTVTVQDGLVTNIF